jgi:hypothetical protein
MLARILALAVSTEPRCRTPRPSSVYLSIKRRSCEQSQPTPLPAPASASRGMYSRIAHKEITRMTCCSLVTRTHGNVRPTRRALIRRGRWPYTPFLMWNRSTCLWTTRSTRTRAQTSLSRGAFCTHTSFAPPHFLRTGFATCTARPWDVHCGRGNTVEGESCVMPSRPPQSPPSFPSDDVGGLAMC